MKLDADNPKLTAYALGELDVAERTEIEAQLAGDESARALVEGIRASASALSAELRRESFAGLTPNQRAAIDARLLARPTLRARLVFWKPVAMAASLLFVLGIVGLMLSSNAKHYDASERLVQASPARVMEGTLTESRADASRINSFKSKGKFAIDDDTLRSAEVGDHLEAINLDNPNGSGAGGYRPADGVATFGNRNTPQGRKLSREREEAARNSFEATKLDEHKISNSGTISQSEKDPKKSVVAEKPQVRVDPNTQLLNGALETQMKPSAPVTETPIKTGPAKIDETGKKPDVQAAPPSTNEQAEIEKLKKDVAELRLKLAKEKESTVTTVDKGLENKYGPNAPVSTKNEKIAIGGLVNAWTEKPSVGDIPPALQSNVGVIVPQPAPAPTPLPGGETYPAVTESGFKRVTDEPLSTFSIDVDTASYANVRRYINQGQLPPRDAVRVEEMLNYFSYNYGEPTGDDPFAIHVEIADCPWNTAHRLARVGIKGREFAENKRPAGNYVFLVDVSGSMDDAKRLPLVQAGLYMLVDKLSDNDRVGIVIYAGESGIPLKSTPCSEKSAIKRVIGGLKAAGSTNGGDGIQKAYKMAAENFIKGGINRVILCTDGDFNVGVTDPNDLVKLIEAQSKTGVFLSVLGFGMGNLKDATMQKLADKGNGNYAYIDSMDEVRKVLVDQMTATLATIAKDVKIQVEFNPAHAGAYRLIGYEKRLLAKQDFNNDKVDAGEVGAGHQVTALYEIVPAGALESEPGVDPLIYQKNPEQKSAKGANGDLLTLKIRYKQPEGETSKLIKGAVTDGGASYSKASKDFKFAAAVAAFGMLLRESPYRGNTSLEAISELADEARGKDEGGYRREFLGLVEKTKAILKR